MNASSKTVRLPLRPGADAGARTGDPAQPVRSLAAAGAIGAAVAVGVGLLVCMAVALIGWFLADAGIHGETTDALRVGAAAWLLGHGAALHVGGIPVGIAPLGLSVVLAVVGFRSGRWAGQPARGEGAVPRSGQARSGRSEPVADPALGVAALAAVAVYVVAAVLVALLVADAAPSIPRAVLGALVFALGPVTAGVAVGSGRLPGWRDRVPGYVRSVLAGAAIAGLLLVAAGAILVAVGLAWSFNEAAALFSALDPDVGDALMLVVVSALAAPNAALFAVSYLSGPGFVLGAGTSVGVGAVTLGPLPAFPLLAATPPPGQPPGWLAVLYAVPVLCAAVAAGLAQHHYRVAAADSAALRGFGVGMAAAVLVTVAAALAGGPMGTGRMAELGVPAGELLVTAVGAMSIGGLLGGSLVAAWQRRRAR